MLSTVIVLRDHPPAGFLQTRKNHEESLDPSFCHLWNSDYAQERRNYLLFVQNFNDKILQATVIGAKFPTLQS